jgi:hypothetical protein
MKLLQTVAEVRVAKKNRNKLEFSSVLVLAVGRDSNVMAGYYRFDLGHNMTEQERHTESRA